MPTAASWTEVRRVDPGRRAPHRLPRHDRPPAARLRRWASPSSSASPSAAAVRARRSSRAPAATRATPSTRCSSCPTAMAGFLVLAIASAVASGGGRELLSREHGVAYPVSPTTDHLGALLLAPLNIAWLLQAWLLLGATAYGVERRSLARRPDRHAALDRRSPPRVGQVVAWTVEAVRRTRRTASRSCPRPGPWLLVGRRGRCSS